MVHVMMILSTVIDFVALIIVVVVIASTFSIICTIATMNTVVISITIISNE